MKTNNMMKADNMMKANNMNMKKKTHSNLDEMQELELLKIEHNGCWLTFWLLLAAMVVQSIAFGAGDFRAIAVEWIVFMILALYLAIACARRGIWDRKIAMSTRNNLIISALAGAALGIFNAVMIFKNFHKPVGTAAAAIITAVITFVLCFVVLSFMMRETIRRQAAMEAEPDDADEL